MTSKVKRRSEKVAKLSLEHRVGIPASEEERPTFSFRYLSMDASDRHHYGWELIGKDSLKPKKSIPQALSDVEKFHVFRYDSDNHPFVSVVRGNTIYPLFIEATFGDIYNHGK